MKIGSTVLAILVLQAVLVSAAMAESNGVGASAMSSKCCNFCNSTSGRYTCDDLLTNCAATCKICNAVSTDKGRRYRCGDVLLKGCPCKSN